MKNVSILLLLVASAFLSSAQQTTAKIGFNLFFEKVYLHTDREQYTRGEDIWFKAYLVNAKNNELFSSSNNLYVELINPKNEIESRRVIRLDKGLGHGDFKLSDSIAGGVYRLRAYTNWMKNFGDNFIFEKQLQVLAPVNNQKDGSTLQTGSSQNGTTSQGPVGGTEKKGQIRFFAEGGSMVAGVPGILAIRSEGANGRGVSASGSVYSSAGEKVTDFISNESGMGLMLFTPVPEQQYVAKGELAGNMPVSTQLPPALPEGFVMNVRNTDSLLRITIGTNEATLKSYAGQTLTLIFRNKGEVFHKVNFQMKEPLATLSVSKMNFPAGINTITLSDAAARPHGERLFYHEGADKVDLKITANRSAYAPKQETKLLIKATDQHGKPVKANFSLAVTDAELAKDNVINISTYLGLKSEIKGEIENPSQYFRRDNPYRQRQLDMLLITQGWRDFVWKRLADSAIRISYAPEQWITVSGRVRTEKGKAVQGANITLAAPQARGTKLFSNKTDSAGRYYFDAVGLYGEQDIRITSLDGKGKRTGLVKLDSLFTPPVKVYAVPEAERSESTATLIAAAEILKRREETRKFSLSDTVGLKEVTIEVKNKVPKILGIPLSSGGYQDEEYIIQPGDSSYFDLYHYLGHKSKAMVEHVDGRQMLFYPGQGGKKIIPITIVNGITNTVSVEEEDLEMRADVQQSYLWLPASKAEKVVIKHLLNRDMSDVYLIYITFKEGALESGDPGFVTARLNGYYQARTFFAPGYQTTSNRIDLRTTIHWQPDITTNEKGEATVKFFNASPKTRVRIAAEGIGEKGVPFHGYAGYDVR